MKLSAFTGFFALASIGMAAPAANAEGTLDTRGPCPKPGSGNISACCYDSGPDKGCKSRANCYTRCQYSGAIGCVAGCASACPSKPQC